MYEQHLTSELMKPEWETPFSIIWDSRSSPWVVLRTY